ncbi:MAG: 2-pyrone-4,6-dicarbaxylate hydrolase [Paracidovorax wautersii]|uniref:2-pyrone-4,6-dicarbaxylate hydrolase n=1 Tax=Paracidovorax wautersii TaxID=1177982 RepID=A0A7V8FQ24_9BURK|nr:MAG: 2-pyrone-4,6-dicarbaxylate hydrolase [Paracidovorax wautersii]
MASGWDCHVHVFDAAAPVQAGHYQPVDRPLPQIEAAAAAQGVGHLVLVQPSVYGTDNRVLAQALGRAPGRHRGVAVVDPAITDADLAALHAAGVRGVRFNLVSPVGCARADVPLQLRALAPRLRALGWHVQWYAEASDLADIAGWQQETGLTFVLDHLAGLRAGVTAPAALQALAQQGAWIKLSGWYRLDAAFPYDALDVHVAWVAERFGERMVWGSDWPHTSFAPQNMPAYASVWQPLPRVLGAERAAAVLRAGTVLYA